MAFGWKFEIAANSILKSGILPHKATIGAVIYVAKRCCNVSGITLDSGLKMSMRGHAKINPLVQPREQPIARHKIAIRNQFVFPGYHERFRFRVK